MAAVKFCQPHWDRLRLAVEQKGLGSLVSESGEKAASNLVDEHNHGRTIDNFDPLMGAHNAIVANVLGILKPGPALEVMTADVCPLCYANEAHEATCTEPGCTVTYDDWIDFAVNDQVLAWNELGQGR